MEGGVVGHNFERDTHRDHLCQVWTPYIVPSKFGSIWPSCFRGEDSFNISQSEKRITLGGHICWWNGTKWRNFIEELTHCLDSTLTTNV